MSTPLFAGTGLEQHVENVINRQEMAARKLQLADLKDRDAALENLVRSPFGELPTLQRAEADFEVTDQGTRGTVRVLIPFAGDGFLFQLKPMQRPGSRAPLGHWDRYGSHPNMLVLSKQFESGATRDDVREWAKTETDLIESCLDQVRIELAQAEVQLRDAVRAAIAERAKALSSFGTMQEDLGRGI